MLSRCHFSQWSCPLLYLKTFPGLFLWAFNQPSLYHRAGIPVFVLRCAEIGWVRFQVVVRAMKVVRISTLQAKTKNLRKTDALCWPTFSLSPVELLLAMASMEEHSFRLMYPIMFFSLIPIIAVVMLLHHVRVCSIFSIVYQKVCP